MELSQKQKDKLLKMAKFIDNSNLATIEEFESIDSKVEQIKDTVNAKVDNLEAKIDGSLSALSEELKKKLESELVLEIDRAELKGEKGDSIKGDKGEPGKDYELDEADKAEIASLITVPIVEKVIEVQTPIVTEVVKEVAVAETPFAIRDKLESIKEEKEKLSIGAIGYLEERLDDIEKEAKKDKTIVYSGGGGSSGGGITEVVAGVGVTVDSTDPAKPIVSAIPESLVIAYAVAL